jgi:parallel beta-helix repeat protein
MQSDTSSSLVAGNRVHHNGEFGVHLYTSSYPTYRNSKNTIRANMFYVNGQNTTRYGRVCCGAILISCGSGNMVYNNIIYSQLVNGIVLYDGSTNDSVYNNTVYNSGSMDIVVKGSVSGAIIKNNIAYPRGISDIPLGTPSIKSNNLTTNPSFVNAAANDLHLVSNSTAIDQGDTLTTVRDDFDGKPRPSGPAHDIGAYELHNNGIAPAAPKGLRVQ